MPAGALVTVTPPAAEGQLLFCDLESQSFHEEPSAWLNDAHIQDLLHVRLKGEVTSARHTLKPKIRPPTSVQYPAFDRSNMPTPSAALTLSKKVFMVS